MRNGLRLAVLTIPFALTMQTAITPVDAYAATKGARLTALADCQRQAKAKRFSQEQTIQRRNFLKTCMIARGFEGSIN